MWGLGVPLTFSHWLPDIPGLRSGFDVFVCVAAAYVLMFLAWLLWSPIHSRLEPFGGLQSALRSKLGANMLPIILMSLGLLAFVLLFGTGSIIFVLHAAKPAIWDCNCHYCGGPKDNWNIMIDAALTEKPQ